MQSVPIAPDDGHREGHGARAYRSGCRRRPPRPRRPQAGASANRAHPPPPGDRTVSFRVRAWTARSLRALGLRIGELEPGPANSIADVAGVGVGHVTVVRDEPDPPAGRGVARTGVTAILPAAPATLRVAAAGRGRRRAQRRGGDDRLPAGRRVGRDRDADLPHGHDGGRARLRRRRGRRGGGRPGRRRRRGRHPGRRRVRRQLAQRGARGAGRGGRRGPRAGRRGARRGRRGRGRRGHRDDVLGLQGRHRRRPAAAPATRPCGVLVLANFGAPRDLRIDGVPVGRLLGDDARRAPATGRAAASRSSPPTRRCTPPSSSASRGVPGSGWRARARSPITAAARSSSPSRPPAAAIASPTHELDPLFAATVDATEEAVVNALWSAERVVGREGRVVDALPHEDVIALLAEHRRL